MARYKTWKVLDLGFEPETEIFLQCPDCGRDAALPFSHVESPIIASLGLNLVFDNPSYQPSHQVFPNKIQCRKCHHIYEQILDDEMKGCKNAQRMG